jgi:Na+/H+-dicarboxylate symporter
VVVHPLEVLNLEPIRRFTGSVQHLVETHLWARVLFGMGLGILVGLALGPSVGWVDPRVSAPIVSWLALPGILFLALIQMIVVALVFASVVRGLAASENPAQLRALGIGGTAFFVVTSAIATAMGLALAMVVRPGDYLDSQALRSALESSDGRPNTIPLEVPGLEKLPEVIVGLLPDNPLASMVGGQMLQVILFAVVVGVALVNMAPEKSAPLFDLLGSIQEVCMKVVGFAMRLAPVAVFGLVTRLTATVGIEVLAGMGVYVLTVLSGLSLLAAVHVAIAFAFGGQRPIAFLRAARPVMLLAFSTSSSAAVMPLTLQTAEDELGVSSSISRFLIPLGATINMNGTALYQGVATVFLAQVFDVDLSTGALVFVVVTAVAASIGSPATPGTGIVILAMVLEGVGIPVAGIALILGVDRILDMSRTAVNVAGDLTACAVLNRWTPVVSGVIEGPTSGIRAIAEGVREGLHNPADASEGKSSSTVPRKSETGAEELTEP